VEVEEADSRLTENDNLAIVSQAAIFFTLFAALLTKLEVDKTDKYDDAMFGTVRIFLNGVGVTMVVGGWLVKPLALLAKKLGDKHVHAAALKGVSDEHAEWSKFEAYFKQLVESNEFMAAWEPMYRKEWAVGGAVGEWRCGNGNGPRDQYRVVFEVDYGLEEVYKYLTTFGKVSGATLAGRLRTFSFSFQQHEWSRENEAMCLARSIEGDDAGLKRSPQQGRVTAWLNLGGFWLEKMGERKTRVVHIIGGDLKGVMTLDWIHRRAMVARMRGVVEDMRKLGKEVEVDEEAGRGGGLRRAEGG